jgi:hypothetical protein
MASKECAFCHVEHTVAVPCIHLNGTAPQDLRQDLQTATEALRHAVARLTAAMPNARDYYVLGADAPYKAISEHSSRMERLQVIYNEIEEIRDHVIATMDFREEQRKRR